MKKKINLNFNTNGFTLAEVLLTLAIVGIVASLTIPSLISNVQTEQYKKAYKTAYHDANIAWQKSLGENLLVKTTAWADQPNNNLNFKIFMDQFIIKTDCYAGDNNNLCWNSSGEKFWNNLPKITTPAFVDNQGRSWSRSCDDTCGNEILVDTNGLNKPNKFGKDRFILFPNTVNNAPIESAHLSAYGNLVKITPVKDFITPESNHCPSGNCMNTSWLRE